MAIKGLSKEAPAQFRDDREEIAYLRQQFSSLSFRGQYKECLNLIESKLRLLYVKERSPEHFYQSVLLHMRCYASLDTSRDYADYLSALLRKNSIPLLFAEFIRSGKRVVWNAEQFKQKALELIAGGSFSEALDYAELLIKMDHLSSNAYFLKGHILRELKKTTEAIEAFEHALELNQGNYPASKGLAECYAELDPAKALEHIGDAIARSPGNPDLQVTKARVLTKLNKLDGAHAALDAAIALDHLNPEYLYQKGELYEKGGQDVTAVRYYEMAYALEAKHMPSLTRLARLTAAQQPERALKYATIVAVAHPDDKDIALLRARLLERCGKLSEAERQYSRVLELDDGCAEAYGARGRLALSALPERALEYYEKAAALEPGTLAFVTGKARAYRAIGDSDAALAAYREAVRRDKGCHEAHAGIGFLLRESDPKAALQSFNRAISLDSANADYYRAKGDLLSEMPGGGGADVLACYDKAVSHDPGNCELRVTLAALLERTENYVGAIEHYRAAVSLEPRREEAHLGLARLLIRSEPEIALRHIDKAIDRNPVRSEYYFLKSRIYSALGKDSEAISRHCLLLSEDSTGDDAHQELSQLLDGQAPRVSMMYINRALEISPNNPDYLCDRAELLEALGERKTASAQYRQALDLDNGCHRAHFGLGRLLSGRDNKAALEHLEKAEALSPANPRYTAEKALCIAKNPRRYPEALDCFDEAIIKDKTMWDIVLAKARLLDEHGEPLPAIVCYRRTLLAAPDCLEANSRMGVLLTDYNPRAALVYTRRASELEPENYLHYFRMSRLLHILGDKTAAEAALQKAIELGGETGDVIYALADILAPILPETALEYCEKLLVLDVGNVSYHMLKGNILLGLGRKTQAEEVFAGALELNPGCHEALARIAGLRFERREPECLELICRADELCPGNASYSFLRGLILDELMEDTGEALGYVQLAVVLAPGNLIYREKLVELLGKTRARLQRVFEKKKLGRLRERQRRMEQQAQREDIGV